MAIAFDVTFPDGTKSEKLSAIDREDALRQRAQLLAQWQGDQQQASPDDFLGPALEGLTSGFLDEASGGVGAMISALGGGTLAEGYRRGYEGSKGRREGFARRNPTTSAALELGGNIASAGLTPEIKAAQALGVTGRLAPRLVNAAATGAGYGALAGAGYAESPEGLDSSPGEVIGSTLRGAAAGGLVGAAAGAGGEALISGVGAAARGARRMVPSAASRGATEADIARTIQRENPGMSVDDLVARMQGLQEQGYPAVVGDIGGVRTRRMARGAADASPEAQAMLEGVTGPRYRAQGGRTEAAVERASGGVGEETRFGLQDRIRQAERERGALYNEAYQRGDEGVSWSPEIADLARNEPIFQDAMREARDVLSSKNNAARARGEREWQIAGRAPAPGGTLRGRGGSGPRASLAYWDQVKRALDRMERHGASPEGGRMTENARTIDMIRRTLVEHLTSEVPAYQRALGVSSTLFGGREAGQIGEHAFDTNMTGTEIRRVLDELTPSEQRLFQASWISKFVTNLRKIGDRQDIGKKIAASPHARDQLEAIFGRERAADLLRHRDIEQNLQRLHEEVTGNSKTARYLVGLGAGGGALVGSGGRPWDPTTWPQALMGAAAGAGIGKLGAMLRGHVNERQAMWIAEALSSGDPERLRRVAAMGQRQPSVRQALSRIGRLLGGAGLGGFEQATQ